MWHFEVLIEIYYSDFVLSIYIFSGNCTKLHPAWFYVTTETTFPVTPGNLITVKCPDGFINQGSETITCQNGIHYKFDNEPRCEARGKTIAKLGKFC